MSAAPVSTVHRAAQAPDTLSPAAFRAVCDFFFQASGIRLGPAKHGLVAGRLQRLAQEADQASLDGYVRWLLGGEAPESERVRAVDRLTTNETYFFREPQHFQALAAQLREQRPRDEFTVWSAASSSGEEAYSIAMLLDDQLGTGPWRVLGTDLSSTVVHSARRALYPLERTQGIPGPWLKRYCLKGHGPHEGQLLVKRELRARVRFDTANLLQPLPESLPMADVVFLRNVLIYFDNEGKAAIVRNVLQRMKPGGRLYTGHAESLTVLALPLRAVAPAIYERA